MTAAKTPGSSSWLQTGSDASSSTRTAAVGRRAKRGLQQLSPNWLNTCWNYILHVQLQSYSRDKVRAQDPLSDTVPQCSFSMGAVE